MSRIAIGSIVALLAVSLVGTTACSEDSAMPSVEGPIWMLHAYTEGEGLVDVPAGVYADANFEDGVLSGTTGCNDFSGAYEIDGADLEIGPLSMTLKACPPPASDVEAAFLAALEDVRMWRIESERLRLLDADGEVLLEFETGQELGLSNTTWLMRGYNNGAGGVVSAAAGTTVTAEFHVDGTLDGSGGCNTYSGAYSLDGGAIAIGPLSSTEMFCASPEGVMDQERLYLEAMTRASTWSIVDRRLELRDAEGATIATFAPLEDADR